MSDDLLAAYEALRDSARALQEAMQTIGNMIEAMQTIGNMIGERGPIDLSYVAHSDDPLKYAKGDLMWNTWSSTNGGLREQVEFWREKLSMVPYTNVHRVDFERFVYHKVAPHYDDYPGRVEA